MLFGTHTVNLGALYSGSALFALAVCLATGFAVVADRRAVLTREFAQGLGLLGGLKIRKPEAREMRS